MNNLTSKNLRALQSKKAGLVDSAKCILSSTEALNRDLDVDEYAKFNAITDKIEGINAAIERETRLIATGYGIDPDPAKMSKYSGFDDFVEDASRLSGHSANGGFRSFGEFANAVRKSSIEGRFSDNRLVAAAPGTYGNESSGPDGGFLVPHQFSRQIFTLAQTEDALLPMTDNIEIDGNSMVFPKDETTPWGTDGVRAYWQQEATSATATKPKLGTTILRLQKLMALVSLTDELVSDTDALDSYLPGKISESIRWKVNEALLFGSGNGQPLGCYSGGAAITVAKDSGQLANTVSLTNLTGMLSRLLPGCFPRSTWLMTPDALPSLFGLTLGNYPIYLPLSKGAQSSPYGTLLGRPIIVSQHAAAFSSQGDILLLDPTYIRSITKSGGIKTDTSIHLYFDADAVAFRATFRVDAQPKIMAPVTQAKSSNQLSAFIQLAAR